MTYILTHSLAGFIEFLTLFYFTSSVDMSNPVSLELLVIMIVVILSIICHKSIHSFEKEVG